jgi:hypothetical protein
METVNAKDSASISAFIASLCAWRVVYKLNTKLSDKKYGTSNNERKQKKKFIKRTQSLK